MYNLDLLYTQNLTVIISASDKGQKMWLEAVGQVVAITVFFPNEKI